MAGENVGEILVGGNGQVHVAPVGTTAPTSATASFPAGWIELGLVTADGVTPTDSKTINNIRSWQRFYASRKIITERDFMVAFVLQQWNLVTVPLGFGGGAVTEPSTGVFRYDPPDPEDLDERAMAVTWQDGSKDYRIIISRGMVTENVETNINRSSEAQLPITFGIIDGNPPWYLLTNDPAFDATP